MDPDRALAEDALRSLAGVDGRSGWRLERLMAGGHQSGAWMVRSGLGAAAVLKVASTPEWSAQIARASTAVARVRAAGYPTPAWLAHGTTQSGLGFQLQALVPGSPLDRVDATAAAAFTRVIDLQSGLDPDPSRDWSGFVLGQLTERLGDLSAAAESSGAAGRRLADLCRRLALGAGDARWPRTDLVHGDLRPANVLFDGGAVSGVVDIEAIGSGTRAIDAAMLLSSSEVEEAAVDPILQAAIAAGGLTVARACVGFAFLDLVRFVVGRGSEVDRVIAELVDRAEHVERQTSGADRPPA